MTASSECSDLRKVIATLGPRLGIAEPSLRLLVTKTTVKDGTSAYLLNDRFVVLLSPPAFPMVAEVAARRAEEARERLHPAGDAVVLTSIATGQMHGRSFSISPRCIPIDKHSIPFRLTGRRSYGKRITAWLREVVSTAEGPTQAAAERLSENLGALLRTSALPSDLRAAATLQLRELATDSYKPRFAPMHGDLWTGNVMRLDPRPFVVIDWRGFLAQGFPIYDLIRSAESFRLSPQQLHSELAAHARQLDTDIEHTAVYLLAALGHIVLTLDQFPIDRFISMATRCWSVWSAAAR
jgi:hypothetical protein